MNKQVISGYELTPHACKRSSQRGISAKTIRRCIRFGKIIHQKNNQFVYLHKNISVVVDSFSSKIITVKHQYKRLLNDYIKRDPKRKRKQHRDETLMYVEVLC